MRLVFAGTPEFARVALLALIDAGHDVALVLTQPDRPSGRGLKLTPSPVKAAALDKGIAVAQPRSLKLDGKYPEDAQAAHALLEATGADAMIVAAYGLILPQSVLDMPRLGCLNVHASLLPRWRGAAPIQRAIEAGDAETGITIMQMDAGLDTGDMLLISTTPILPTQSAGELHDVLATQGGKAIVDALARLEAGDLPATPQPADGVTYAAKLDKAEAPLDCTQPADLLARRVRAFNPVPGATLRLPGMSEPVKVWKAVALPQSGDAAQGVARGVVPGIHNAPPAHSAVTHKVSAHTQQEDVTIDTTESSPASATVLRTSIDGIDIATANGALRLLELQKAGGKRQPVDVFVRGLNGGSL